MDLHTEFSQGVVKKALECVEVAKKTGKLKKGANEATKAIERGTAKLILIAKNTNPQEIIMHIPVLCTEKDIPCVVVATKEELGSSAGLVVPTSAVAIIQEGDAKNLIKELASSLKK